MGLRRSLRQGFTRIINPQLYKQQQKELKYERELIEAGLDSHRKTDFINLFRASNQAPRDIDRGRYLELTSGLEYFVSGLRLYNEKGKRIGRVVTHDFLCGHLDADMSTITIARVDYPNHDEIYANFWIGAYSCIQVGQYGTGSITDKMFENKHGIRPLSSVYVESKEIENKIQQNGLSVEAALYAQLKGCDAFSPFEEFFDRQILSVKDREDLLKIKICVRTRRDRDPFVNETGAWSRFCENDYLFPQMDPRHPDHHSWMQHHRAAIHIGQVKKIISPAPDKIVPAANRPNNAFGMNLTGNER